MLSLLYQIFEVYRDKYDLVRTFILYSMKSVTIKLQYLCIVIIYRNNRCKFYVIYFYCSIYLVVSTINSIGSFSNLNFNSRILNLEFIADFETQSESLLFTL